jgi:anti-sigma factor RsiW
MTCREAQELIADALLAKAMESELDPARSTVLSAHLESCADCRAEMASMSALWNRLGDLPAPEPSDALDARWRSTLQVLTEEAERKKPRWVFPWPERPVWQMSIALATLVIGLVAGSALDFRSRQRADEVAKLREEVGSMRAMVALSLLRQDSASDRLRGIDYSGGIAANDSAVAAALVEAVRHDSSVNVRLAAIDALSNRDALSKRADVAASLARALPSEESPMVQAALVDYLADARDRQAIGTIEALAARPDLNPAVRERTQFALAKLTH